MTSAFWESLPLGRGVELLARDAAGVVALGKPEGVLSHPNEPRDVPRSLLRAEYVAEDECFVWPSATGESERLWLLNRLDSATSGVILACADVALARAIRTQFKLKQVAKVYLALVFGAPRQAAEVWQDMVAVERRGGHVRTAAGRGRTPAESRMSVVRAAAGEPRRTLIRLEPKTGRSHQLRVQCAKRHLPIVGDQTYGDFKANREFAKVIGTKRLFLHSFETAFTYEHRGVTCGFKAQAPIPAAFDLAARA